MLRSINSIIQRDRDRESERLGKSEEECANIESRSIMVWRAVCHPTKLPTQVRSSVQRFLQGSVVADSKHCESQGGYSSGVEM